MGSSMGFEKRVVVVTGAASGIGAAICRRFSEAGARIVLLDLDEKGLAERVGELSSRGVESLWVRCDVSSEEECRFAIRRAIERFGGIDVLVNNAGITQRGPFIETAIPVFRRVMEVNFFGSLYCTKAAIASLVERRGLIIVIESIAGLTPLYGRTGYSASKMALHGLFTSLRTEVRRLGVHVMIVCPGFVRTNLQSRALGRDGTVTQHRQSKVGREESPEAVADAIYRGAIARRRLVITTPVGKLSHWMNRWWPAAYERLMAWALRSELET